MGGEGRDGGRERATPRSLDTNTPSTHRAFSLSDVQRPLDPWRRKVAVASSKLAGLVLRCVGFSIHVEGRENIAKAEALRSVSARFGGRAWAVVWGGGVGGRAAKGAGSTRGASLPRGPALTQTRHPNPLGLEVALFNHVSWADSALIMYLLAASGVSRASNAHIPIIGTCIHAYQNIYIERDAKGASKGKGVAAIIGDRVRDGRWPMVVVAPEGTCGDGRCVLRFRTGAFVPGAPVLPVLIKYEWTGVNPAWTIIDEPTQFARVVCQFRKAIRVRVLPPYVPSAAEKADPSLYAANVRALYSRELGGGGGPRAGCRAVGKARQWPTHPHHPLPSLQGYEEFAALTRLGVRVTRDGTRVVAPPGVLRADGTVDLTKAARKKAE